MEKKTTLVVVDFQYDFCLLGAPLYVPGSDKALWNISHLIENKKVDRVIFTADWHPANHCSFKRNGGEWNDHCVQFSKGAAIHDLLLYGCIGAGIPYEVLTKGALPSSEEYGVKVAPATIRVNYHTIYSHSMGIDINPDEQVVVCGLAGDFDPIQGLWKTEVYELAKWLIGYYYGCGIKKEVDADGARKICDMCEAIKKSMSLTPTDGLGISNSDLDQIGAKSYYDVDRVLQTLTCKASPENDKLQDELTAELGPDVVGKITERRFKSRFKRLVSPIIVPREMYD